MHHFVTKFGKNHEKCKKFAENQVNEKGNVPRRGGVFSFSDLETVAFSITAEAVSIDCENYLFKWLDTECPGAIRTDDAGDTAEALSPLRYESITMCQAVVLAAFYYGEVEFHPDYMYLLGFHHE